MYHYWCGCLDHIHKMYMVAVTLPSYPAFRPMFVINILIYKIPKQFSEICGNLRHYLQIVFILVLIKHICLAAICKWCFCVKKVFCFFCFFTNHGIPALLTMWLNFGLQNLDILNFITYFPALGSVTLEHCFFNIWYFLFMIYWQHRRWLAVRLFSLKAQEDSYLWALHLQYGRSMGIHE